MCLICKATYQAKAELKVYSNVTLEPHALRITQCVSLICLKYETYAWKYLPLNAE